jgi:steroid 5-alpha reductase family enzyme
MMKNHHRKNTSSESWLQTVRFFSHAFVQSFMLLILVFFLKVWFISIGYAASIAAFVVVTSIVLVGGPASEKLAHDVPLVVTLQLLAALTWGVRLGWFLAARERQASYQASIHDQTSKSQSLSLVVKIAIWLSTSLLYVCMFSPIVFLVVEYHTFLSGDNGKPNNNTKIATTSTDVTTLLGVAITWLGLGLESWADHQKSVAKAANSNSFVRSGLYAWVRYPNYLGEITFWLGIFVSGIVGYKRTWWHWAMAITGLTCILLIMMGSTKRLEKKQAERYGHDAAFKHYIQTVPVLFPWIPIYSLRNVKVYLE